MSIETMLTSSLWNMSGAKVDAALTPVNALSCFLQQAEKPESLEAAKSVVKAAQKLLIQQIEAYRNASVGLRRETISKARRELKALSGAVKNASLGQRAVLEMMVVLNRNFLTYIDVLHRAEMGPAYVSMLKASGVDKPIAAVPFQLDFIGMKDTVWVRKEYALLSEYFEWQFPVGILPKVPQEDIPDEVWMLFQQAQREYLDEAGKSHIYQLDSDVAKGGFDPWGIYPRIQAFGLTDNFAVDSPQVGGDGKVVVAEKFGNYRLPGGGQLEVEYKDHPELKVLPKAFDEVLEEQFAELYQYVGEEIDNIDRRLFHKTLESTLHHDSFNSIDNVDLIRATLKSLSEQANSNSALMTALIDQLYQLPQSVQDDATCKNLRASLQVEAFKLTVTYQHLLHTFSSEDNVVILPIVQVADMRGHASKQTAFAVMTKRHPVNIIQERYPRMPVVAGDDMAGSEGIQHVTPAQYVAAHSPDFSHDVTAWAASLVARALGRVDDGHVNTCLNADDLGAALQANLAKLETFVLPVVREGAAAMLGSAGLMSVSTHRVESSTDRDEGVSAGAKLH